MGGCAAEPRHSHLSELDRHPQRRRRRELRGPEVERPESRPQPWQRKPRVRRPDRRRHRPWFEDLKRWRRQGATRCKRQGKLKCKGNKKQNGKRQTAPDRQSWRPEVCDGAQITCIYFISYVEGQSRALHGAALVAAPAGRAVRSQQSAPGAPHSEARGRGDTDGRFR